MTADAEFHPAAMPDAPAIEMPNVFPLEWPVETPKLWDLYERAKRDTWNPTDLDWAGWDTRDLTREQRLGVLYWYLIDASFENSGVAAFAQAAIRCYEDHTEDPTKRVFVTIARDELNHDEFCKRVCDHLYPGFPGSFTPENDFERAMAKNIDWIAYNGSRYWSAFAGGFRKYPIEVLFCSFMTAELLGVVMYDTMAKKTRYPLFRRALQLFHRDETRHFALTQYLLDTAGPRLTDETRAIVTKQIRAGFNLMSMLFLEPLTGFWQLPDGFLDVHRRLWDHAVSSGIGVLDAAERRAMCRAVMLRIKRLMDRQGIVFPAIPELDISGRETVIDGDDFLIVAL
ncbi:MAG: hypothetical protein U0531_13605 [Dehalococcoidia bacterium]